VTEPRYVGGSSAADLISSRWDELAGGVAGADAYFDRSFRTRIYRSDGAWLSLTSLDDDFHEMRIALRVAEDGTVLEAVGRMNRHPYDTCPRAVESMRGLVGVNVFAPKAPYRDRLERSEGCLHLFDMLGIAFRAFRISKGHEIPHDGEPGRRELIRLLPHIRDTCVSFATET
jgi:Protein of unknown function (DUF2889)